MLLTIEGRLPSLNEYTVACRANAYAGAEYKKKVEQLISLYIVRDLKGVSFPGTVYVHFRWYEPNKKRDLDNICFAKKFIFDALVRMKVIKTDSWRGVIGFDDSFYVDPDHPRVEVEIGEANGREKDVCKNDN